jgi:hypothetical protein
VVSGAAQPAGGTDITSRSCNWSVIGAGNGCWSPPNHNRAAFVPYPLPSHSLEIPMRLFFGIILGCALTIGGAYIADRMSGARPMVNWDVVAQNFDSVVALARDGWKKITG